MIEATPEWAVSPTQVDTFLSCPRKWAWKYIANVSSPPHPSAQLGTDVHAVLEEYLRHGTLPDQSTREGEIATAGLHLLPEPGTPGMQIEKKIRFRSPAGFLYSGRIDLIYPDLVYLGVVLDHKTTSDFRWMKTPEVLLTDPQAIIYAASSLIETGDDEVKLRWVYYRTKGTPKALDVEVLLSAEHVEQQFHNLDLVSETILTILDSRPDPLTLPPVVDTCEAYGGCPYRHLCNISLSERISAMTQGPVDMSVLLARLQAAAKTPPAPAFVPPAPPPVPSVQDFLNRLQAAPPAVPVPPPAPAVPVPPPVPLPIPMPSPPVDPPSVGTWSVNPEGNYEYLCACGNVCKATDLTSTHGMCPRCGSRVAGADMFSTVEINPPEGRAPAAAPLPPPVPPPVKAGPGRPRKNPAPAAAPAPAPAAAPSEKPIRRLYVDISGPCDSAEAVVFAPARKAVNEKHNVQDYRMLEFGTGPGMFAAAVQMLLSSGWSCDALTVRSETVDANAALSVLIANSDEVYYG